MRFEVRANFETTSLEATQELNGAAERCSQSMTAAKTALSQLHRSICTAASFSNLPFSALRPIDPLTTCRKTTEAAPRDYRLRRKRVLNNSLKHVGLQQKG
ncbi:uncharacterized protein K460DRAFT_193891 [Cucurbitaria berberidis CBS 394.84]|uniref:Uncharacterized protein n=1 Tax=Cucurbitaria berberidis CBS 394.84 TaxID=1168544 RepID=A0A9P4L425_9PLEO|nr:uncharacterized protein K460DRAFT_193891 [Cucurbitaria berberidis CBS 394.84]KAF1840877.1 hypothetical protein K460DRAFT_193891 [Cucurbitaria berberidis CBS 394.84]